MRVISFENKKQKQKQKRREYQKKLTRKLIFMNSRSLYVPRV